MIETNVVVRVRFVCGVCGKKQDEFYEHLELAATQAEAHGFEINNWIYKGCPRQTCFCLDCVESMP